MRLPFLLLAVATFTASISGCAAKTDDHASASDEQDLTSDAATLTLSADQKTDLAGTPTSGKGIVVDYALERLPQCRGNIGGGGPAWNITGFYSENGAAAKTFEVTKLTDDGNDRVAKPGRITPSAGGDVAIWFQVTSGFGCEEYDSAFGQNYHLTVKGAAPDSSASITFDKSGAPTVSGTLAAGSKVKVHYEQDRLPDCRRSQGGYPQWSISGFAQLDKDKPVPFDTAEANGSDRTEVDAYVDLAHAGTLSLWFQVADVGGCMKYDSNSGANYTFDVTE